MTTIFLRMISLLLCRGCVFLNIPAYLPLYIAQNKALLFVKSVQVLNRNKAAVFHIFDDILLCLIESGINIHTVKPIDREAVIASAKNTGRVLTVENHNKFGGLYSAVSEVLSEELPTPMQYVAIEDKIGVVGKLGELKEYYGLTVKDIVAKAKKLFK